MKALYRKAASGIGADIAGEIITPDPDAGLRSRPALLGPFCFSRDEADLALVTDGEDSELVLRYQEAVQSDVTGRAV